ncbi:hypothetical protein C8R45DRAFT_1010261 [Mycena sanguinolenta]|nr:hypothetical protein C8R45DRAFT_1010261 [Mycena sanguinolenta]
MGWLLLRSILCAPLGLFLAQMPPPLKSSSGLPQRPDHHIRQARDRANAAPYLSSRRQSSANAHAAGTSWPVAPRPLPPRPRPLAPRPNGDLESQHTAQRDADRDQQLAQQETPSRRRRRIPENRAGDENRALSPTPAPHRRVQQPVFAGAGTPLDSQRPEDGLDIALGSDLFH